MASFTDRVAIVTGAGGGLGRSHALGLAKRGAKVVVNDLGTRSSDGSVSSEAAEAVVGEIRAAGGTAIPWSADVTDLDQVNEMAEKTLKAFGRIDILVNNAGILRDKSFAKVNLSDFNLVVNVHLSGSANCTSAVWKIMQAQNYGRVVFTSSGAGLYGNFGQAAYSAAKMAMVGLMHTLHLEGQRYNIRVNCLVPTAATRMTQDLISPELAVLLTPEAVTPALLYLVGEEGPSRMILCAGAGVYSAARVQESSALFIAEAERTPEKIAATIERSSDVGNPSTYSDAFHQMRNYADLAARSQSQRGGSTEVATTEAPGG